MQAGVWDGFRLSYGGEGGRGRRILSANPRWMWERFNVWVETIANLRTYPIVCARIEDKLCNNVKTNRKWMSIRNEILKFVKAKR